MPVLVPAIAKESQAAELRDVTRERFRAQIDMPQKLDNLVLTRDFNKTRMCPAPQVPVTSKLSV